MDCIHHNARFTLTRNRNTLLYIFSLSGLTTPITIFKLLAENTKTFQCWRQLIVKLSILFDKFSGINLFTFKRFHKKISPYNQTFFFTLSKFQKHDSDRRENPQSQDNSNKIWTDAKLKIFLFSRSNKPKNLNG